MQPFMCFNSSCTLPGVYYLPTPTVSVFHLEVEKLYNVIYGVYFAFSPPKDWSGSNVLQTSPASNYPYFLWCVVTHTHTHIRTKKCTSVCVCTFKINVLTNRSREEMWDLFAVVWYCDTPHKWHLNPRHYLWSETTFWTGQFPANAGLPV